MPNESSKHETEVNKETGEIKRPTPIYGLQFPKKINSNATRKLDDVAGKAVDWVNLRDHDELAGRTVAILKVELVVGEFTDEEGLSRDYVRLAVVLLNPDGSVDKPLIIYTGSAGVMERALKIMGHVSADNPIIAKLEKAGKRAWLLK